MLKSTFSVLEWCETCECIVMFLKLYICLNFAGPPGRVAAALAEYKLLKVRFSLDSYFKTTMFSLSLMEQCVE
jgi:hypothetical protein